MERSNDKTSKNKWALKFYEKVDYFINNIIIKDAYLAITYYYVHQNIIIIVLIILVLFYVKND